ncbi:MAG: cytochrome c-type biogenesis protein CcmH [Rhodocyclaceae bacterium]|jgi:cytochrome c-type biogenesis protein CcmH|nr:cytochrome c-type biogenesis protein CcmH [Rhodocyclaceae bacterium]
MKKKLKKFLRGGAAALAALMLAHAALAKEAAPLAEDPAVEQRMVKITEELRCLVCQNESLAGSQADLAKDLREEVRGLIKAGKSDDEVREFLVSRYGDFVLYRPQVKPVTYLLWGGPFLLLIAGIVALVRYLRRRNRQLTETPLSEEERQRAEALLKDNRP